MRENPTAGMDKRPMRGGRREVKHDLRKLCQSLIRTEIDVEVV
jgi:hypothetical protein